MAEQNCLGTLRKRGVIVREIIKDRVNEQQGTLYSSEIPSSKDLKKK